MLSELSSFFKGVLLGSLFCLTFSYFADLGQPPPPSAIRDHFHHHIKASGKEALIRMPDSVKLEMSHSLRVFCIIMVRPKILTKWAATKDTWSKHCDRAVFYTSESSKALEAVDLQEQDEWVMMRKALTHAYNNAGDLRWFFLAQATTFAIIENLKYLVLDKDPEQPFYIGNVLKSGDLEYAEYSSGIVLSFEALRRLTLAFEDELKCPLSSHSLWKRAEEKELAVCLKYTGVFAENGEDALGKGLFNSKSVGALIADSLSNNPADVVQSCCPDLAITFNGMTPEQMHVMMFGVYRLRPYGHVFHDSLIILPAEGSDND
ncbi:C1GALT1-specific chaperone 1-like [Brienomyrus brachyistius]|uniref:C1GALT1-specific chaperone 1-like n=1 Tax=Brienomyrus brachyistius TaxID=42636 RepID=UPI0020B2F97A|nr:C1GALT1-specific chaperone 1-like [Brienomyrus brachyistius]XP_048840654.1 C1GALT1-specific chaperone 1-like [Brienomyrus brachyistius]XP_048840655.1 C1GALT1-specific chaperone 1-like [Brienomyrus brachyistius]